MFESLTTADKINTALLLVTAIGVLIAVFGVRAAFVQIRAGAAAQRAIFLKDLYMQLRTDVEVSAAFYLIEYDRFKYTHSFHGSDVEPKIDRLLTLLDLVCEMHSQGAITTREISFFDYQFKRVVSNPEIGKYLAFLENFYRLNGLNHKPFEKFQSYARALPSVQLLS